MAKIFNVSYGHRVKLKNGNSATISITFQFDEEVDDMSKFPRESINAIASSIVHHSCLVEFRDLQEKMVNYVKEVESLTNDVYVEMQKLREELEGKASGLGSYDFGQWLSLQTFKELTSDQVIKAISLMAKDVPAVRRKLVALDIKLSQCIKAIAALSAFNKKQEEL